MTETNSTPNWKPDSTPDPKADPKPAQTPEPKPAAAPGSPAPAGKPTSSAARPAVPPPPPSTPIPRPAAPASRGPAVVLTILGFVLLAIGLGWLWTEQQRLAAGFDPDRLGALQARIQGLDQRVSRLEQRPAAAPAPSVDLRTLEARIAALEKRPAAQDAPSASPALESQIADLRQRLAQAEQAQAGTAARAAALARLQAAAAALAAGRPLGDIPSAPAALTRFATTPPPTEAALRLDFDAAAARAAEASKPATESESMAERMWLQIQSLVTVRDGDRVLSGAPASYILGQARAQLFAGNLAGAIAAVDKLDRGAASAMADWSARAHALLDARAALAKLMAAE